MNLREQLKSNIDGKSAWFVVVTFSILLAFWTVKGINTVDAFSGEVAINTEAMQQALNGDDDKKTGGLAPALSYEKALSLYKDRRIQFNEACQSTPTQMTFKNGTAVMLDNRSGAARIININGIVNVPAYGFKIVKLTSTTFPKTILVDCGKQQNVATILIQK